ncbi:hypothetical protein TRVL_01074 [Trypanosoma vivax]|nr:hypothetical protein TRVL_01074 [Trypanosoma vivax]
MDIRNTHMTHGCCRTMSGELRQEPPLSHTIRRRRLSFAIFRALLCMFLWHLMRHWHQPITHLHCCVHSFISVLYFCSVLAKLVFIHPDLFTTATLFYVLPL